MFDHLKIWMNGQMVPWKEANVHVLSHGLSRGSAIFEVFGIHPGPEGPLAFRMDKHLDRLFRSAELLGMEMAYTPEQIAAAVAESVKVNQISRGLIKIMAFYGEQAVIALVLDSKLDLAICGIPEQEDLGLDRAVPIDVCFSKWRKIHNAATPVEAKACANYLNGMLARKDAVSRGYDLGVLLTTDGYVAEGSIESVFMVKNGVLKTSPRGNILLSITRDSILEAAPVIGIEVRQEPLMPQDLMAADEIFTGHSGIKVLPVKRIEERTLEAPGPVTVKMAQAIDDICNLRDERFRHWFQPVG